MSGRMALPPHARLAPPAVRAAATTGERDLGLLWDLGPAFALVGLVVAGTLAGAGGMMRLGYPVLALLIALSLLLSRRIGAYVCFCLWLFVLTPWLRRFVDLDLGWLQVNPVMMAPWGAAATSLLMLFRMVAGPRFPLALPMLVAIVAAAYGMVLALLKGSVSPAVFDWLRYAVPPCFAAVVIVSLPGCPSLPRRVVRSLALGAALAGGYGVYQFVAMPPWDALWMHQVNEFAGLNSIGLPEPYEVRVFSLLNSPHSFAGFLGLALPMLLILPSPLGLLGLALGSVGLLLSLARAYWVTILVSFLYLLARGPLGLRMHAAVAALGLAFALPAVVVLVPEAMHRIEARIDTLASQPVQTDVSFESRQNDYEALIDILEHRPFGMGLATGRILDGQVMDSFHALGLVAGSFYLGAAAWCFIAALRLARRGCPPVVLGASAVALQVLLVMPLTSALIGELGFFSWLALALCHTPWRPDGVRR